MLGDGNDMPLFVGGVFKLGELRLELKVVEVVEISFVVDPPDFMNDGFVILGGPISSVVVFSVVLEIGCDNLLGFVEKVGPASFFGGGMFAKI
jgi:hypothetical protein